MTEQEPVGPIRSLSLNRSVPVLVAVVFAGLWLGSAYKSKLDVESGVIDVSLTHVTASLATLQESMCRELEAGRPDDAWQVLLDRASEFTLLAVVDGHGQVLRSTQPGQEGGLAADVLAGFSLMRSEQSRGSGAADIGLDDNQQSISAYLPVVLTSQGVVPSSTGTIVARYALAPMEPAVWDQLLTYHVWIGLLLLAVMLAVMWFLRRFVTSPVQHLVTVTQELARGEPGTASRVVGEGELAEFSASFNKMSSQLSLKSEERRQVMQALEDSETRLEQVIDATAVGIWDWEVQTGATTMNERCAEILGYTPDDFLSMTLDDWLAYLHPSDVEDARRLLEEHMRGETQSYVREIRMRHKRGHWVNVLHTARVIECTLDGRPKRMIGSFLDVTDRVRAQEQLYESERRLSSLVDSTSAVLWEADPETLRFTFINRRIEDILGYSSDSWTQDVGFWEEHLHPEDKKWVPDYARSVAGRVGSHDLEYRMLAADGSEVWLHQVVSVVAEEGEPNRLVGIMIDITDREQNARALRRSQKMDALGQLSGGIAHDFNNLLGVVQGSAELLESTTDLNDESHKYIDSIMMSTARAAELTRQLLGFARRQEATNETVSINQCITDLGAMIERSLTPEIAVDYRLAADLWDTEINRGEFEDVLLNFIINARDAMAGRGRLLIETTNRVLSAESGRRDTGAQPGDYVCLSVTDTGVGIAPDVIEQIFEPFFTTKLQQGGTGLGLAMAFGLARRSGGHVNAVSDLGEGTTINLYLPRTSANRSEQEVPDTQQDLPMGTESILVVDDEKALVNLARLTLEMLGYRVSTASDGKQGLEVLKDGNIDLLFTDVVMDGGINGFELAEKALEADPGLKILLTSGFADRAIARSGQTELKSNLLRKPYRRSELAQRVRETLDDRIVETAVQVPGAPEPATWSEELRIGVPAMDDDHRALLDLITQAEQIARSGAVAELNRILDELQTFVRWHFGREEALMQATDYPGAASHRALHEELTETVQYMEGQMAQGELNSAAMLHFLWSWWHDHTQIVDRGYVQYCEGKEGVIAWVLRRSATDRPELP